MQYPPMLMHPLSLVVFTGIVFLWLHCAASIGQRLAAKGSPNPNLNVAVLFGGPIAWLVVFIVDNQLYTGRGWQEWFHDRWGRLRQRIGGGRQLEDDIVTVLANADGTPVGTREHRWFGGSGAMTLTVARQMIDWAVGQRASDILFDPKPDQAYELRYRVDGLLREPQRIDRDVALATINCFKSIAQMDIAERRRAQDGSLLAMYEGREIKLRVATAGTVYGEKIAIRVLDSTLVLFRLDQLGFSDKYMELLRRHLVRPHGMILVCGPTGSGKTTTLYAAINELADTGRNIITIEDPIEYALPIASQTAVNTKAGITFAGQLRHVLRQSPDVIMVGEIRDGETARIALQAAETGHLVFSTLHSNDAVTGLIRLTDLGIEPFLISGAVNLLLSQRLVRRLCPQCRNQAFIPHRVKAAAVKRSIRLDHVYEARGCEACGQTGYRGREGIFEMLEMSPILGEKLKSRVTADALRTLVKSQGMTTMQQDGVAKILNGTTSLAEVVRVTGG